VLILILGAIDVDRNALKGAACVTGSSFDPPPIFIVLCFSSKIER
jgi:hypothetical protein